MIRRAAMSALLVWCIAGVRATGALAQTASTTLTVTGGSTLTFANPTLADYVAGYIDGPTITFTVATVNGGSQPRTTTVEICATGTSLGNGKDVSKLMWQPADNSQPYQSIITGCSGAVDPARVVGSQTISRGNSWSGGVRLRMMLDWIDTAPSYATTIEMALSVAP